MSLTLQFQKLTPWASGVVTAGYVKLIDPPENNPFPGGVRTIGRIYIPDGDCNNYIAQGAAGAEYWWQRVAPAMLARPWVWAWETTNEPQPVADYNFCLKLAQFTKRAAQLMHAKGLLVVGGNLAEGNPGGATQTEEANLFCAIAPGLAECDFWSQHAYWVPDGYPHKEAGYNKYHALRYQTNRAYAQARGIKLPKIILTEGGWDFGIVDKPKCGWLSYGCTWERYFADLKRFADDLAQDLDVVTCNLFVSGPNGDWSSFEINEAQAREVLAYVPNAAQEPPPEAVNTTIARPLPSNRGTVSQVFGANVDEYQKYGFAGHEGLDYAVPVGTKVLACTPGKVIHAGAATPANANYGIYVVVDHGRFRSWYCHLSSVAVQVGQIVEQGQVVGLSGNTGKSTGAHLHFAVQVPGARNGSKGFVDPWALRIIFGD